MDNLRIEADEWLIWLDRRFDCRVANERLQTLARFADTVASAQASTKRYSLVRGLQGEQHRSMPLSYLAVREVTARYYRWRLRRTDALAHACTTNTLGLRGVVH